MVAAERALSLAVRPVAGRPTTPIRGGMRNAFPGDRSDPVRPRPRPRPHGRPAGRDYALESLEPRVLFAAGDLDPSFSVDGLATTSFEGYSWSAGNAVVVQADGKIVVAGDVAVNGQNDFGVARYRPDGTLDTDFGGTGRVTLSPLARRGFDPRGNETPTAVVVQADGKII